MLRPEQLELTFAVSAPPLIRRGRDPVLEEQAARLLSALGARSLAVSLKIEWNPRMRSAAGRAHFVSRLISLNPRLCNHGVDEINRTVLHELAHLLAHARAGRKRIAPHGAEWQLACADLGVPREPRCHTLPFPVHRRSPRYVYRCPSCQREFPRVQPIRRQLACLACCRQFNAGKFWKPARFQLVQTVSGAIPG